MVSALASCARGPGFDPRRRRGKFVGPNTLPFVSFTGMTLHDTVRRPSDRDVNWRPPVQGQSSPVQVKDPYTGSILMHVGSSCKHTGVYNVHLPRINRN